MLAETRTRETLQAGTQFWRRVIFLNLVGLAVLVAACGRHFINYAELRRFEKQSEYFRLPVIFVPGIKGSQLVDGDGDAIWGVSGEVALWGRFRRLAFDYEHITEYDPHRFADHYVDRGVYPKDVLLAYALGQRWFVFHKFIVYRDLKEFLVNEGRYVYRSDQGVSLFFFPYDWRLDNRVAAVKLAMQLAVFRAQYDRLLRFEYCKQKRSKTCSQDEVTGIADEFKRYLEDMRERHPHLFTTREGPPQVRFHIVAHSMGGLVAQYFLNRLDGDRDVGQFVTIGVPTKGAMDALKSFVEGEYPDTLFSTVFGGLFYTRKATTYISASFPSIFQMLPRYDAAVTGIDLADLGLDGPPSELTSARLEQIVRVFETYGGLPNVRGTTKALGRSEPVPMSAIRRHFATQLLSAACFHEALDAGLAAESERLCAEDDRILRIVRFLQRANRDRPQDLNLGASADVEARLKARSSASVQRRLVYGGHCTQTLSRARFERAPHPRIVFVTSSGEGQSELYYGDGRVPFESAQFTRPKETWINSFFFCADHVDLVKDDSFKYNLLRALLSQPAK
jgi:pimeloyl-ACP methyl ester carboxylesterase